MGAMQAQVYAMAKWAVGLRLPGSTADEIEAAFQRGEILRTHVLRPTWHFVHPADIRWLVKLTAPSVHAKNRFMYKKLELDDAVLQKAGSAIESALKDGPKLRTQLQQALYAIGIEAQGQRLAYIIMYAELEGLIASGPRRGKQFTYALMQNVSPEAQSYSREEMLFRLAQRYFASRAPATVRDFANWSGLSRKDADLGARQLGDGFYREKYHEAEYILSGETERQKGAGLFQDPFVFFLPDYDEFGMSYHDRKEMLAYTDAVENESEYSHWLVVNGVVSGTWQQQKSNLAPEIHVFEQLSSLAQNSAVFERAKLRYLQFWGN
jgi:ribosomal protein S18 acetylase RimI-like enzyme